MAIKTVFYQMILSCPTSSDMEKSLIKKHIATIEIQSTLDIVTLDLRLIRYKIQIFDVDSGCSYG